MGILANIVFYLLAIITVVLIVTILFSKNTKVYLSCAVIAFSSVAGLYILLKSPVMFVAQVIFFTLGAGAILLLGTKDFRIEDKLTFNFNLKTIFSLIFLSIATLLMAPFFIQQIKNQVISTFCTEQTFVSTSPFANLMFVMFSILIITLLSGFYTIAVWRKKWLIR